MMNWSGFDLGGMNVKSFKSVKSIGGVRLTGSEGRTATGMAIGLKSEVEGRFDGKIEMRKRRRLGDDENKKI